MQLKSGSSERRAEVNLSGIAGVERVMQNYEEKGTSSSDWRKPLLVCDERSDFPVKGLEHTREEKVAKNISEPEKFVPIR
jgi:hypothetical protein